MATAKVQVRVLPITTSAILTDERAKEAGVIAGAAFKVDALTLWLRHSNTGTEAEDLRNSFEVRVRTVSSLSDGSGQAVLALKEGKDGENEQVLGVAIWRAVGLVFDTGNKTDNASEEPISAAPEDSPRDPSLDTARLADLTMTWNAANNLTNKILATGGQATADIKELKSHGLPEEAPPVPHFELTLMAVAPEYQGKGVGSALLDWGVKVSEKRGVPVVLGASDEGRLLYVRRGFVDLGVRLIYATEEDEKECGRLNDDLLVRWPAGVTRKGDSS